MSIRFRPFFSIIVGTPLQLATQGAYSIAPIVGAAELRAFPK